MSELPSVTAFQAEVARMFFALPEAESFLLAGGLALLAQRMSERPTQDMDAFTSRPGDVQRARSAFEVAALQRGWVVELRQSTDTFVRIACPRPGFPARRPCPGLSARTARLDHRARSDVRPG